MVVLINVVKNSVIFLRTTILRDSFLSFICFITKVIKNS